MRYNPKEFNASTKKLFESAEYSEIQKRAWAEYNLLLVKTQADILPKVIDFLKTNNVEEGKSVTF